MAVTPDRFIKGSRFTEYFTLDDPSDQVVPKAGTDTKPGALMLNTGTDLPADLTNNTDALTAAALNAMLGQVDTTAPFCGNVMQQAIVTAIAQSFACNTAAQEAVACAIAGNTEAVACLQTVLSCASGDSGKYYVMRGDSNLVTGGGLTKIFMVNNGVTTDLTPSGLSMTSQSKQQFPMAMNTDKPVAYLGEINEAVDGSEVIAIHQQTITDTGVTDTVFDLSTIGIDNARARAFYRNGALYLKVADDTNSSFFGGHSIWKLNLNGSGLITGGSKVVNTAFGEILDIQGNYALCKQYNGGGSVHIVNVTTGAAMTIAGENNNNNDGGTLSPDGTKFFLFSPGTSTTLKSGPTSTATVTNVISNALVGRQGFVTADSRYLITHGVTSFQSGIVVYDTSTLAVVKQKIRTYNTSVNNKNLGAPLNHNIVPSNNAFGFDQIETYQILEFDEDVDVWNAVGLIESLGKMTGIHRVQ